MVAKGISERKPIRFFEKLASRIEHFTTWLQNNILNKLIKTKVVLGPHTHASMNVGLR